MEFLRQNLMLLLPLFVLQIALMIAALIDLVRRKKVTGGYKWIWVVVIVLFSMLGPIIYFAFGRKEPDSGT